jgi:hypothetical protein
MKAKSIKGKTLDEIKLKLEKSKTDGFNPTLAFVFLSVLQDIVGINAFFTKMGIAVFGSSSLDEIHEDEIMNGSISVMLLDINPNFFKIYFEEYKLETAHEAANKIARQAKAHFSNPTFIVSSSQFEINYVQFLQGITDVTGNDTLVYGGIAGDRLTYINGVVFTKNKKSTFGLIAIVFDSNLIEISGTTICGWNPLGTVKTVTESIGGRIFKIDDQPVLDLTMKYAGIDKLPEDYGEATVLVSRTLSMQFPKEKGDPVTLVGMLNKEDRSMYTQSDIPVGTKMQFAVPPEFEIIDQLIERCEQLKSTTPNPDAVLIFSCGSRIDSIGPLVHDEIAGIKKVFNAPTAGFFSNGEIAPAYKGKLDIHNNTTVCVILKEKE